LVEVISLESTVFEREEQTVDDMFIVIEGSVSIQQLITTSLPSSGVSTTAAGSDARVQRVMIRNLRPGECFEEVELILEAHKRLADATASSEDTKLLRVQKKAFFSLLPQRDRLDSKLAILNRAFDAASPLEPEQLGAMYYSVNECSFQRNEGEAVQAFRFMRSVLIAWKIPDLGGVKHGYTGWDAGIFPVVQQSRYKNQG